MFITKTNLYKFDPLKPHFYIVKLGFTGVYIIFLISAPTHRLWVLVRTASPRRFKRVPTIYVFEQKYEKYQNFLSENFQFLEVKLSIYLNRRVFVMYTQRGSVSGSCPTGIDACMTPSGYATIVRFQNSFEFSRTLGIQRV